MMPMEMTSAAGEDSVVGVARALAERIGRTVTGKPGFRAEREDWVPCIADTARAFMEQRHPLKFIRKDGTAEYRFAGSDDPVAFEAWLAFEILCAVRDVVTDPTAVDRLIDEVPEAIHAVVGSRLRPAARA